MRRESDACRKSFTIKPSNPLSREIVGMFVRNLHNLSQQDLAEFKKLLEKVSKQACAS
ncbi:MULTISPECIES: hypothetical protein [unclassified Bartonella]|uniref:hypothetical protein n=1 Tax=unclassified Bartonella TaxID=2645622 RepID=UPI0035CF508E